MPRTKSLNFVKLNDELFASDAAIDPILASAKITVLKVDGKDVPAAEAPLQSKISAIGALVSSGDKTQDAAQLIAANGQLAAQGEQLQANLTASEATIAAQNQKISELTGNFNVSQASVQKLTSENATQTNLLEASNKEVSRITAEANRINREVSQMCVSVGCLDLKGEDGKPLAKDAKAEDQLAAADKLPIADKLKSFGGALHAAASKVGIQLAVVPNGGAAPAANNAKKLSIDEQVRQAKALKK
jgi:hypothetical protein